MINLTVLFTTVYGWAKIVVLEAPVLAQSTNPGEENQMFTDLSADDLEAMLFLTQRVFADYRNRWEQGRLWMVYNFSQTTDNEDSGLGKIVQLARADAMYRIGICRGSTEHGYAGFDHSVKRLNVLGFDKAMWKQDVYVQPIQVNGNLNTGSEAEALVRYADGDVGIIAPPFHLLRAFMTTVSAMYRLDKKLRIYAIMGDPLPWTHKVRHSQGTLEGTREQLLLDELKRLEKYRAPEYGSMLSAQKVLAYLDRRDSQ